MVATHLSHRRDEPVGSGPCDHHFTEWTLVSVLPSPLLHRKISKPNPIDCWVDLKAVSLARENHLSKSAKISRDNLGETLSLERYTDLLLANCLASRSLSRA
jgi:hypothetical protein